MEKRDSLKQGTEIMRKKIELLFDMLSCSNSEIAQAAGCSRSYISHIRNGSRELKRGSKALHGIMEGVYRFADSQDLLDELCRVVDMEEKSPEVLVPALVDWLFDADKMALPQTPPPLGRKGQGGRALMQQGFGERLDAVMKLLDLSNTRLARLISVDDSLVSRWRRGLRSPKSNKPLAGLLVASLLERARGMQRQAQFARLAGLSEDFMETEAGAELWGAWLFGKEKPSVVPIMDNFLETISNLPALQAQAPKPPLETSPVPRQERYWNTEGLRQAVVRFLTGAAEDGGELLLYSDETFDWATGDAQFYALWKALMAACLGAGVKIRIIHNIDRGMDEMLAAINSWIPLYMTGRIEPYVCHKAKDGRFSHTIFLRKGAECVWGTVVNGASDNWYEYITDDKRLHALQREFEILLSSSAPLVKVYVGRQKSALFTSHSIVGEGDLRSILAGPSLCTLPERTLAAMLERSGLGKNEKKEILKIAQARRAELETCLGGWVCEMMPLPAPEGLAGGRVCLNLGMELLGAKLYYTPQEYCEHIGAILGLLEKEKNYHFVILPELPFEDIQVVMSRESVTVIHSDPPCAAFCLTDAVMVHAFSEYFDAIKKRCRLTRDEIGRLLRKLPLDI